MADDKPTPLSQRPYSDSLAPAGTLRVLQITDTHLYADPGQRLLGVNTQDSFRAVLDTVQAHNWRFDLVLATGDLVHDASPAGYQRLTEQLGELDAPVYCLPGNHDEALAMARHLGSEGVSTPTHVDIGDWRIILLDSVVPGEEGGRFEAAELTRLNLALADTDRHCLVCMHHQPIPVGSRWIDTMAISNGNAFLNVIDSHSNVRGVLWGHIHQTFDRVRRGQPFMATPSTCVQFTPGSDDFQVDSVPPGCRFLALHADGSIETEVIRLESMPHGVDLASAGY
jgi:Icc protein